MPRNGSGTYTLPAGNPVVNGSVASSTNFNATMSDLATALTNSVAKDGQTVPAADLPMGGFKHTNVGNAAVRNQYAAAGQVQDGAFLVLGGVSGTDTIVGSASPPVTALVTGQVFRFQSAGANTGGVTLAVDSLSAVSVLKYGTESLVADDIASLAVAEVFYDGTHFQLLNPRPADPPAVPEEVVALTSVTGTTSIVAGGPALTGYDSSQIYVFDAPGDSSGATTLQVGSLSALTVKAFSRAIVSGDFLSGQRLMVAYDGAEFQLLNPSRRNIDVPGDAPAYACRAWVNFDGTTNTGGNCDIRASGNVSSVTDNGTGDYTVNFATSMQDDDYAVTFGGVNGNGLFLTVKNAQSALTTSSVRVQYAFYDPGNPGRADFDLACVAIFR